MGMRAPVLGGAASVEAATSICWKVQKSLLSGLKYSSRQASTSWAEKQCRWADKEWALKYHSQIVE
jgi:hypothetical protein